MIKTISDQKRGIEVAKSNMEMTKKIPLEFDRIFAGLPPYFSSGGGVPLLKVFQPEHLQFYPGETLAEPLKEIFYVHNRFVMIAVREGEFQVDGVPCAQILHAGECLLIPPFCRHSVSANYGRNFRCVFISFQLDEGRERLCALGGSAMKLRQSDWKILLNCMRNFICACDGNHFAGASAAVEFGLFLENLYERKIPVPEAGSNAINYSDNLVGMISRIICEDFSRRPTIKQIAQRCNVSPSSVRQIFKKSMGKSIGKYICSRHLNVALELLRSSELSLAEIALRTGYGSATALANAIRRECGLPPSDIRKKHKTSSEGV